jgi:C_GCAxxG_C_C family probable redox protein
MTNVEHALEYFDGGFSCAQSTCASCSKMVGLQPEIALRVSGAFGGGIARMGETCGVVNGALMLIGFKYGMTKPGDQDAKLKTYEIANEFVTKFKARHQYLKCKELLGCDISTPEGAKYAKEHNIQAELCPKFIQDAIEIMESIL